MKQELTCFNGPTRAIQVSLDAHVELSTNHQLSDEELSNWTYDPSQVRTKIALLELDVQHFSSAPKMQHGCINSPDVTLCRGYAVPFNLLPGLGQIEAWAAAVYKTSLENDILHPSLGFFRSAFVNLARAYLISIKELPHVR